MCFLFALLSLFPRLRPLPKHFGHKKEKDLPDKCREVTEVWNLKCNLVWRTRGAYHCSFLRRVNLIQFSLDAFTINIIISLANSHSLFFFSIQQSLISLSCLYICILPSSSRWQPCSIVCSFVGWIKLTVHCKWLLLQNSAIILKFSPLSCLCFTAWRE